MKQITNKVILLLVFLSLTYCRFPYKATSYNCTSSKCTFSLTYTGKDEYYKTPLSPIIKNLVAVFSALTYSDFNIKIYDANNTKRFQVPQGNGFPEDTKRNFSYPFDFAAYNFNYNLDPFDFQFFRRSNNYTLWSTYQQDFIFSDYYLQIGTQVQNDFIYGLGERFSNSFRIKNGKWSMWNKDHAFVIDQGTGQQTYGYYPYYLNRDIENQFHITYFRSSSGMDVIKQTRGGKTFMTFKVVGGIIDLRFILNEVSPSEALVNLNSISGRSNIPPFWAMGFHQCRWGYQNSSMLLDVLANYQKYGIPLDTIWSDIDYMQDFEDFTIDQENFPLSDMKKIRQKYKYIPIIDAGIKIQGIAYEQGLKRNVYINDAWGQPFVGAVWPGDTTFVDFLHPNASKYWEDMLEMLYKKIQFDGVWLDMNQFSSFCSGPCTTPQTPKIFDYANDLPYNPGFYNIQDGTISLNCTHYNGIKEADLHNFNGYLQTKATYQFLKSKNLRPFIVSRSSTLGSSVYGNHWTGDNAATWEFLQGSISNIFNSHLSGFKMVGQDICGFGGNTTQQLCARWYQLGSLYPFSRSHNAYGSEPQQPYALGDIVRESATKAIKLRYSLLKSLYLQVMGGETAFIWKPLFFSYPADNQLYTDQVADTTFTISDFILVAPILEEGKTSRPVYFPGYYWLDLFSGKRYKGNQTYTIKCNLTDTIPIFLKESFSIFLQNAEHIRNTKDLNNIFTLYSALSRSTNNNGRIEYSSMGFITSFKDHHNQSNIDRCIKSGNCNYSFIFTLAIEDNKKTLIVTTTRKQTLISEEILLQRFILYYDDKAINFAPQKPLSISGSGQTYELLIDDSQFKDSDLDSQVNLRME